MQSMKYEIWNMKDLEILRQLWTVFFSIETTIRRRKEKVGKVMALDIGFRLLVNPLEIFNIWHCYQRTPLQFNTFLFCHHNFLFHIFLWTIHTGTCHVHHKEAPEIIKIILGTSSKLLFFFRPIFWLGRGAGGFCPYNTFFELFGPALSLNDPLKNPMKHFWVYF